MYVRTMSAQHLARDIHMSFSRWPNTHGVSYCKNGNASLATPGNCLAREMFGGHSAYIYLSRDICPHYILLLFSAQDEGDATWRGRVRGNQKWGEKDERI